MLRSTWTGCWTMQYQLGYVHFTCRVAFMRGLVMLLVMQSNLTAHLMSGLCQKNSHSVGANALGSSRLLLPHLCFVKPEPLQHCLEPNPVSYKKRLVISGLTMRFWRHRSKSRLVDRWQIAPNCSRSLGPAAVAVHQRLLPACCLTYLIRVCSVCTACICMYQASICLLHVCWQLQV